MQAVSQGATIRDPSAASEARPDRNGDHRLSIWQEPCRCIRARCECGHSPQQFVEARGVTLDDLLCPKHGTARR